MTTRVAFSGGGHPVEHCLAIPFRLIHLPIGDLIRSVRGALAGAILMASIVALVRALTLASHAAPPIVLAVSIASGIFIYLAWLWWTENRAVQEARIAWAWMVGSHDIGTVRGQ